MPAWGTYLFSEAHALVRLSSPVLPPPPRAQTLFGNALVRETLFRSGRGRGWEGESKPSALLDTFRVRNEEEIAFEPRGPALHRVGAGRERKQSWKARPRPFGLPSSVAAATYDEAGRYGQDKCVPKQSLGTRGDEMEH